MHHRQKYSALKAVTAVLRYAAVPGFLSMLLATPARAQVVSSIYSFNSAGVSGAPYYVVLVQGQDGALYGTTQGSLIDYGSIFRLQTNGVERDIYSLDGTQGMQPYGGLTLASDGTFYGTTAFGGASDEGVLFRITRAGAYTVLHDFAGDADGGDPLAPPIQASDGNLYGGTIGDLTSTIYQYTRAGVFSTIYQFDQAHGSGLVGQLIQGSDGNLYGTTNRDGAKNCGTVFKLTRSGTIFKPYSFPCGGGGAYPVAGLLEASDGNFYGTTEAGGGTGCQSIGCGTIFKMTPAGAVRFCTGSAEAMMGLSPSAHRSRAQMATSTVRHSLAARRVSEPYSRSPPTVSIVPSTAS